MNTRFDYIVSIILLFSALGPCGKENPRVSADGEDNTQTDAQNTQGQSTEPHTSGRATRPQSLPDHAPVVVPRPKLTPITERIAETVRTISEREPTRANNVFAKMGGSSVVNHGFLHCLDPSEGEVDLDGRSELEDTLAFFRAGRVGARSPFVRTSLAAAVGWSLRQALGGRPSYVMQEVRATHARWALAFFGSNDVEGKNAHTFAQRLDRLINVLVEKGVVPILGSTYPRRPHDAEMNEQVRRYNRVSYALANAWGLPYIDFHQAMLPLPGRGLARDGYHPNSYVVGPRSRACDFGETGLQYGNNQRNLLVLSMLDQLRHTIISQEEVAPNQERMVGSGTQQEPKRILSLPFSDRVEIDQFENQNNQQNEQNSCLSENQNDPRQTYRIVSEQPQKLRISAISIGGYEMHIQVKTMHGQCLGTNSNEEIVNIPSGTHHIIVTAVRPRHFESSRNVEPTMLFVLDIEPER